MGKILTYIVLLLTILPVVQGCSTSGCSDNQTCVPRAGFYSYSTGSKITVDSISIGGVGAPNDSLLVTLRAGETQLPLRANYPTVSFFFRYLQKDLQDYGVVDTLTIDYTTIPYFADEDCGAMFRYTINDIRHTSNLIDSVAMLDSVITNVDLEQIQIYFRTEAN